MKQYKNGSWEPSWCQHFKENENFYEASDHVADEQHTTDPHPQSKLMLAYTSFRRAENLS